MFFILILSWSMTYAQKSLQIISVQIVSVQPEEFLHSEYTSGTKARPKKQDIARIPGAFLWPNHLGPPLKVTDLLISVTIH